MNALAEITIEYTTSKGIYCREEYALINNTEEYILKWENHNIIDNDIVEVDTLPIIWVEKYIRYYEHIKKCIGNAKINVKIA